MEISQIDYILVPCGLIVLAVYHVWLVVMIIRAPERTVIGLNAESRRQWVYCLVKDPLKNGTLAVQTIRNNMMASTQLATISITLSSLISAFVSSYNSSSNSSSTKLSSTSSVHTYKYFAILVCFLLAFFCYLQCTRYYAHVSFFVSLPSSASRRENIEYVAKQLNRGSIFWSLGLRAFYLSFPLMLWIFGGIPMFLCCCGLTAVLYFLDTTSSLTRELYQGENNSACSVDSFPAEAGESGDSNSNLSRLLLKHQIVTYQHANTVTEDGSR